MTEETMSPVEIPEIPVKEPKEPKVRKPRKPKEPTKPTTITGSPKKPKKKKVQPELKVEDIESQVKGLHALIAIYAPEAMISDENAKSEAQAIKGVVDAYGLEWLERYAPIFTLIGTIAIVEFPTGKAVAAEFRRRQEEKKKVVEGKKSQIIHFGGTEKND